MFSKEVFPSRRNSRLQPEKSNQQWRLLRVFQRVHLYPHMSANRSHIKTPCSSKGCEQLFNLQVASNFSNQLECTQPSVHRGKTNVLPKSEGSTRSTTATKPKVTQPTLSSFMATVSTGSHPPRQSTSPLNEIQLTSNVVKTIFSMELK